MASLVLGIAGEAIGPSLFGAGFSLFGATVSGPAIGGAIGALGGSLIDAAIAPGRHINGPRLSDINIRSSTEGSPIPTVYGRVRLAGQLIWASQFNQTTSTTSTGGKGIVAPSSSETDYLYSISFAVGLCAGKVSALGRVWADGVPIDITQYTTRFYDGSETQDMDPLIQEIESEGNTPSYRGLCYIVFEDMPLANFGNRIPQLQFELIRSISDINPAALENVLGGVALIPGAGEFVYASDTITADDGNGTTVSQNDFNGTDQADITVSLNELQALAPNLGAASLVVGWFGNDLRCGEIAIKPGVEAASKNTYPDTWGVDGVARANAHLVSEINGMPAYGGTPSDKSVVDAIQNLKARGLRVMFYPFLFMDVPAGNALTDPYSGASGQPVYPWRGRITCDPASGVSGSPDKTSAAATQVANFFGAASVSDFSVGGTSVLWTGGDDWGWRRAVLHYAHLCAAAGGVDAFVISSELRGITQVRSGATSYPAVAALKTLAADVRSVLGSGTKIGYAADWSEYNNHQTGDAPGAVLFNLDPLWSDANIDFIGIDNYMPLADWRDGTAHLDYSVNGPTSIYDPAYLSGNIKAGEDYDWFYASAADRDTQTRTPITDGVGKPWVFRSKDIWNWWANTHVDRPSGTETSATAWAPQSKPVWFTELGCPAVDKGANEPNVFVDPKSSESSLPYYSDGGRDDLMQRRFLEAHLNYWTQSANNPVSTVYSAPMLDTSNDYRQGVAEARRLIGEADRVANSSLPIVMDQASAIGISERLLMDAWTMRETATFALAPSQLVLDPTDEVELNAGGRFYRLRLTEIDDTASRAMQACATDPSIYETITGPARAAAASQSAPQPGRALVVFADLPLLTSEQKPWDAFAAAFASPWPGSVLVLRSASDSNYKLDTTLNVAASIGETTSDLYSGPIWRWDEVNTLTVKLYDGTLASLDDLSVFGGANALALQNADGEWELLQFENATLTAPGEWSLTKLLRGQAGTENEMASPLASGARVLVLNSAMQQLGVPQDQYALPFNYLWGPQGKPLSDSSYQGASEQFEGVGYRPYAPCQLRAVYDASGDLSLSWIRRDRSPAADGWDQTEIPMSETSESYDIEILNASGAVIRTFSAVSSPALIYKAANIASDFHSGLPSPFRFTAYQLSSVFGRGPGKTASFYW